MGRPRLVPAAAGLLALVSAGLTACVPEPSPSPSLPACPARAEVVLEPTDGVNFSLPRAVSPEGDWVVLSRVVGPDLVLSLRATTAGSATRVVGTMPYANFDPAPLVSVGPGGAHVVFGLRGRAAVPSDPPSVLHRWRSTTDAVEDVEAPTVASPPPGVAYPPNALALSSDGRRALWSQTFRDGPEPYVWHRILTVTDALSDAVLAQWEDTGSVGSLENWISSGGHLTLDGNDLVDLDTGSVTDLNPTAAAVQAAFPGPAFLARAVSDNGRYVVFQRWDATVVPAVWDTVRWDMQNGSGVRVGSAVAQSAGPTLEAVNDAGAVLRADRTSVTPARAAVVEARPDGSDAGLATSVVPVWPFGTPSWTAASVDLETIVTSQDVAGLGFRLVALRCS